MENSEDLVVADVGGRNAPFDSKGPSCRMIIDICTKYFLQLFSAVKHRRKFHLDEFPPELADLATAIRDFQYAWEKG